MVEQSCVKQKLLASKKKLAFCLSTDLAQFLLNLTFPRFTENSDRKIVPRKE